MLVRVVVGEALSARGVAASLRPHVQLVLASVRAVGAVPLLASYWCDDVGGDAARASTAINALHCAAVGGRAGGRE
jgi:hypothetical protein